MAAKGKIGQILLEQNLIEQFQLKSALDYQAKWGKKLGVCLVELGFISESKLARVLGQIYNLPTIDLDKTKVSNETINCLNPQLANKYNVVPVLFEQSGNKKKLFLATADPSDLNIVDELSFHTGFSVSLLIGTYSAIERAQRRYYHGEEITLHREAVAPLTLASIDLNEVDKMELIQDGEIKVVHLKEESEAEERGVAVLPQEEQQKIKEQAAPSLSKQSRFTTSVILKDELRQSLEQAAAEQQQEGNELEQKTAIGADALVAEEDKADQWQVETRVSKEGLVPETAIVEANDLLEDIDDEKIDDIFANRVEKDAFEAITKTKVEVNEEEVDTQKKAPEPIVAPKKIVSEQPAKKSSQVDILLAILQKKQLLSKEDSQLIRLSNQQSKPGQISPELQSLLDKLSAKGLLSAEELARINEPDKDNNQDE